MKTMKKGIILLLACLGYLTHQSHAQEVAMFQDKIVPLDAERSAGDRFGGNMHTNSVSIFGDYAVVGAMEDDTEGDGAGAAYIFQWISGTCGWVETDKFFAQEVFAGPPTGGLSDRFGTDVSINGNMVAVSASGAYIDGSQKGRVYIYEIVAGIAEFRQAIMAFDEPDGFGDAPEDSWLGDNFGVTLDLSDNHLIVGANQQDRRADGTIFDIMNSAGAAYIYERTGSTYDFQNKIVAGDRAILDGFGSDVSIHGDYAVVGAWRGGDAPIDPGSAYVFELQVDNWVEIQNIPAFNDVEGERFGWFVSISEDYLAISAIYNDTGADGSPDFVNAGAVYMYDFNDATNEWDELEKLVPSDAAVYDNFGTDIDIFEDYMVIGARRQDSDGSSNNGSAYIYKRESPLEWTEKEQIKAIDPFHDGDEFGRAVSIHGKRIIVGAPFDDHDDIGPDYDGEERANAGSAYMFELNEPADEPVITASEVGCSGGTVTLTITGGDLNDAVEWEWYEGDCDGDPIGTGESIDVFVDGVTTYCARGVGECDWFTAGDCACITPELGDSYWHKTTINGLRDRGTDITTDAEGNVYMVGEYFNTTEFEGVVYANVIATSGDIDRKSYIAKYDHCGDLLWVAYSTSSVADDDDFATKVTLDEMSGHVYVAGNFDNGINFTSGFGEFGSGGVPTYDLTSSYPFYQGYVARFDANNGLLEYIDLVNEPLQPNTEITALTIDENTGDIFVGGHFGPSTSEDKIFVRQYSPDLFGIGSVIWDEQGSSFHKENLSDMDYYEEDSYLWLIGDFETGLTFMGSSISAPDKDAFIAKVEFSGVPSLNAIRGGNMTGNMWGNGIALNKENGEAYIVGTFLGYTINAFGTGTALTPSYSTYTAAYYMGIGNTAAMLPIWSTAKLGEAWPGNVEGADVAFNHDNGHANFVGHFAHGDAEFTGAAVDLLYDVVGSSSPKPHIYVVAYDSDALGTFQWQNGTKDPVANNGSHIPTGIATNPLGEAFVSGGYSQNLGYISGTPFSGDLFAPVGTTSLTMRVQSTAGGDFQMPATDNGEDGEIITNLELTHTDAFLIKAYPNPVNNLVLIEISNFNSTEQGQLSVLNLEGKVVMETILNKSQTQIDFSDLDPGVYIIRIVNGDRNAVQRIVKS